MPGQPHELCHDVGQFVFAYGKIQIPVRVCQNVEGVVAPTSFLLRFLAEVPGVDAHEAVIHVGVRLVVAVRVVRFPEVADDSEQSQVGRVKHYQGNVTVVERELGIQVMSGVCHFVPGEISPSSI